MKTWRWIYALVLVVALGGLLVLPVIAQKRGDDSNRRSKNGLTEGSIGDTKVTITYGRPKVNGRQIWGALVPYGKVWRAGADEATTITFSSDVKIEGKALAAGTYSLFLLPGEKDWAVIINKTPNQWGAFSYKESDDVLRVTVEGQEAEHQEEMTFLIEDANVVMHWEKLKVPFKVEAG